MMKNKKNNINAVNDNRVEFFNDLSNRWDDEEQNPQATTDRLDSEMHRLNFHSGQVILDVGCGTGQVTDWLAKIVSPARVTAVDFSEQMISKAKAKNIDADFEIVDVCKDKLPENKYDVVFCFHCFPHFRDKAFALENFQRALKPNGELIVMHIIGREQLHSLHDQAGEHVKGDYLPCKVGWGKLLQAAGFTQTEYVDEENLFLVKATAGS